MRWVAALALVFAACSAGEQLPLTVKGSGNHEQAVPLSGGEYMLEFQAGCEEFSVLLGSWGASAGNQGSIRTHVPPGSHLLQVITECPAWTVRLSRIDANEGDPQRA